MQTTTEQPGVDHSADPAKTVIRGTPCIRCPDCKCLIGLDTDHIPSIVAHQSHRRVPSPEATEHWRKMGEALLAQRLGHLYRPPQRPPIIPPRLKPFIIGTVFWAIIITIGLCAPGNPWIRAIIIIASAILIAFCLAIFVLTPAPEWDPETTEIPTDPETH